jgi:alcohol-forming fatty acyl-CoA reductase
MARVVSVTDTGPSRPLAEALAGKRVFLTGVTGFVGEALLHRILTQLPDTHVSVLVRPRGSQLGVDRVKALLAKPIFAEVVEACGGVEELIGRRIRILDGDLAEVPQLPADLDAVVHCAGDVSFDPPVDEAFLTNVVGTRTLLERVRALGAHVHYVHVSTAYVAGRRRGAVPEGPVDHSVDVDAESAWALSRREVVEAASRTPDLLAKLRTKAERAHRRAGPMTAATDAEQRRRTWVKETLVRTGTERARSLGWTDCYTFTKALGERVVEAHAHTAPATILRPSIIESALRAPHPGWIEGFKMAEPIILAYGRGELPEFPSAPDMVVDIVPVDHVVAAITAVLATPPPPGAPSYFHVSSGARNPLTFGELYGNVRAYFDEHPFVANERGAAALPEWRFPGAPTVERLLRTSERATDAADWLVGHLPRSDRSRDIAVRLARQRKRLEFLRRYTELYREYAQTELSFVDDNTLALSRSLHADDRESFRFDTAEINWPHYIREVHCPAVTAPIRQMDELRSKRRSTPPAPARISAGNGVAAVFDMDGTLLSSNVVESYLWMRLAELDGRGRLAELGRIAAKLPSFVRAERHERSGFLRAVYREYAGADVAELDRFVDESLTSHILARLSPEAVRRIREHRAAGHTTVLLTGAIRQLTRPLGPLFDHIEAADLAVDDRGIATGHLVSSPLVGESRAAWLNEWARREDVDLSASFGYADSHSDLPLLQAVGQPVVVRPDVHLQAHAKKNRWPIVDWASPAAAARSVVPAGAGR